MEPGNTPSFRDTAHFWFYRRLFRRVSGSWLVNTDHIRVLKIYRLTLKILWLYDEH